MTEADKFALLRDLAYLVKKYGPVVFSDLAAFLRNSEAVAELVAILEATESAGRRVRLTESRAAPTRSKASGAGVQRLLSKVEKDQPQKAQVLSGFYGALAAKRALPSLRELRNFAADNGLRGVSATSREKAIGALLRDLAARSLEDIGSMLGRIRIGDATGDRTLEGWTDVILNKHRSPGTS